MRTLSRFISFSIFLAVFAGCAHVQAVKTREDIMMQAEAIKAVLRERTGEEARPVEEARSALKDLPAREDLIYKVRYLGMTIGTVTASIKGTEEINGRDAYKFELTARTDGLFAKIFKVEDRYVSYMDVEDLRVVRSEEYRSEGNYRKSAIVEFDYENNKAYYRHLTDGTEKAIDIPADVHDAITANYYFRMIPWEAGDTVNLKIYADEKVYDMIGLVRPKVNLNRRQFSQFGTQAYAFEPYALLDGEMVEKGRAVGYFAASGLRLPLLGEVDTPLFGKASVSLNEAVYR